MDSGANTHMQFNQGNLHSLLPCDKSLVIMVGNGALLTVNCTRSSFFFYFLKIV